MLKVVIRALIIQQFEFIKFYQLFFFKTIDETSTNCESACNNVKYQIYEKSFCIKFCENYQMHSNFIE